MDAGITYIKIIGKDDMRFILSEACNKFTEPILRLLFMSAGMELKPNSENISCTTNDLIGRYDLVEGIDMILKFVDNTKGTIQQKTLYTNFNTATFEELKKAGGLGAWYYCTAQYYFVIYTVESDEVLRKQLRTGNLNPTINTAILLNLPEFHRLSLNGNIIWSQNKNNREGRTNPFRYTYFKNIPKTCIIGEYKREEPYLLF